MIDKIKLYLKRRKLKKRLLKEEGILMSLSYLVLYGTWEKEDPYFLKCFQEYNKKVEEIKKELESTRIKNT